jgi:hypothetical protein
MSTSAMVKFYINGEKFVGKETCINKLKNLLDYWDMCDELIPVCNNKVKDAGDYWYRDFIGYLNKSEDIGFPVINSEIELPKDFSGEILFSDPTVDEIKAGKYNKVYGWKKETHQGRWYDSDSFYHARLEFERKEKEYASELLRLEALKNTVQYYTLKEEEMQRLEDDLSYNKDMLEDVKDKIYICQYMIDLMETMADMYGENYNDFCNVFVWFS